MLTIPKDTIDFYWLALLWKKEGSLDPIENYKFMEWVLIEFENSVDNEVAVIDENYSTN